MPPKEEYECKQSYSVDKQNAKHRGNRLHQLISSYLRGLNNTENDFSDIEDLRRSISPIVSAIRKSVYKDFIEKSIFLSLDPKGNKEYGFDFGYSGRLDCLAYWEGKLCLIEWKTSSLGELAHDVKRSAIQAASYAWALRETHRINVETIMIAVAIPNMTAEVFHFFPDQIEDFIDQFKDQLKLFSCRKNEIRQVLGCEIRPGIVIKNPDQSTFKVSSYPRIESRGLVSYKAEGFFSPCSAKSFIDYDDQETLVEQDDLFFLTEQELLGFIASSGKLCLSPYPEDEDIYRSGWNVPEDVKIAKVEAQIFHSYQYDFCKVNFSDIEEDFSDLAQNEINEFIKNSWIDLIDETDNLAKNFYKLKQFPQAQDTYLDALEKKLYHLDLNHPSIIFSLDDLANVYVAQGHLPVAEEFFLDALCLRRKLFGAASNPVIQNLIDLAHFYFLKKDYINSKIVFSSALINMIERLGESDPQVEYLIECIKVTQEYVETDNSI